MTQAANSANSGAVKAVLADRLDRLARGLEQLQNPNPHQTTAAADIRRWQQRGVSATPAAALQMPPGDPI